MKKNKKEVNYGNIKVSKAIPEEEEYPHIFSLLLLKDKRIASCSSAKTIRLYLPSNDYTCEKVIHRHSQGITSICELDNGTTCSFDKAIIIGDYIINNAHNDIINKVISLPNNRMASCSNDKTIKIWKSAPPYSDTPLKVLEGHKEYVISILYIKERDIMISGGKETLRFWNMTTYNNITVIDKINCASNNSLYQIDKKENHCWLFLLFCNNKYR